MPTAETPQQGLFPIKAAGDTADMIRQRLLAIKKVEKQMADLEAERNQIQNEIQALNGLRVVHGLLQITEV